MRKKLTAVVLAVLVFSLIAASAASLGGINASTVGAETTIVAACDVNDAPGAPAGENLNASFTTGWDAGLGEYTVTGVTISGIDDTCVGLDISVTLDDGTNPVVNLGPFTLVSNGSPDDNFVSWGSLSGISAVQFGTLHVSIA